MKSNVFFVLLLFVALSSYAQIAINTDGSTANPSAMLDVKSDTAGILIPRMSSLQRDAIANPVQGLMVFVTDENTFYYFNGSSWIKIGAGSSGWTVGTSSVYTDSLVGIGTSSPGARMEIYNNTSDTSLYVSGTNTDNEEHYGIYNQLLNYGTGWQYGIYNKMVNSISGTSPIYLFENYLQDYGSGSGNATMVNNVAFGSKDGSVTGICQQISNTGNGNHYGLYNSFDGSGTGSKYGVYNYIPSSTGGKHYGTYNNVPGRNNWAGYFDGRLYVFDMVGFGTINPTASLEISNSMNDTTLFLTTSSSGSDTHYGIYNKILNTATSWQYGIYNKMVNSVSGTSPLCLFENYLQDYGSGSGNATMVRNVAFGSKDGSVTGVSQQISNTGNGNHYGLYNSMDGSGTGSKYGVYNFIPSSTGGKHYGTYNHVPGSNNWAGYFEGRMYVSDKVGIGTEYPNELLEVSGAGQKGRMIISDGGGSNRYATLLVSPYDSYQNGRIEAYHYGAEVGCPLEVNTVGNGNAIFGGSVLPEDDNSKDLGSSSKAWQDIYYYSLHNVTAASFAGRHVTKEMLNFPLKDSGDEKTGVGLNKLDIHSLPPELTQGESINSGDLIIYNYQANYEEQVEIEALQKANEEQNQKIEHLLKMIEEQNILIKKLLNQK